jgi:hypothetical protein
MGSVPPARRFDAHRALTGRDLPSRPKPDGGPPRAFALLQRSIAAPPHRPVGRSRLVGRCFLPWALVPYDTCRNGGPAFSRGFRPRGVPRPGFGYPPRGVHHRSSRHLAAPERPSASPLQAFSSNRSGPLSEPPALVALLASIRLAPRGACGRDRLQGVDPGSSSFCPPRPEGRGASMPARGWSLQSVLPLRPGHGFVRRGLPSHAWGGMTSHPTCVTGSSGAEGWADPSRDRRLSWGSSPYDRRGDVPTGARGGLMASPHDSARRVRSEPIRAPSHPVRPAHVAPTRTPPSFGEDGCRPLPNVRACFSKNGRRRAGGVPTERAPRVGTHAGAIPLPVRDLRARRPAFSGTSTNARRTRWASAFPLAAWTRRGERSQPRRPRRVGARGESGDSMGNRIPVRSPESPPILPNPAASPSYLKSSRRRPCARSLL